MPADNFLFIITTMAATTLILMEAITKPLETRHAHQALDKSAKSASLDLAADTVSAFNHPSVTRTEFAPIKSLLKEVKAISPRNSFC